MAAKYQTLALVRRPDLRTVQLVGGFQHLLVGQCADLLAVFDHEGHVVGPHLHDRLDAGHLPIVAEAEAGVEKAGIMDSEFTDQGIVGDHFGGMILVAHTIGDDVIIRQNTSSRPVELFGFAIADVR